MKTLKFIILSAAIVAGLSSCIKEMEPINQEPTNTLGQIVVSPDFNFETYRNIEVVMTGYTNGLVEVMSTDGVVYQKAYLQKKQQYEMQVTIPTHEKFLVLRFKGKTANIEITSDVITWNFK
ncbi:MAG: hypothetical protein K9H64_07255 [Bacteroidales bacterium]|nr:hypothetical protein [Bacteroidales bacterium]MCF8455542.1 hypothetical protein [Bacteroidales bacterium]